MVTTATKIQMTIILRIQIFLSCAAAFWFTQDLYAMTRTVCPECQYKTVSHALDSARHRDTIIILGGNHQMQDVTISKSITIIGRDGATIQSAQGGEIFIIGCDSVKISGLRLEGVLTSYLKENAAIRIRKAKHFEISNNQIINCFYGIYLQNSARGIIEHNEIQGDHKNESDAGNAIHAWYSENLVIKNNELSGHRDGIYFEFVNDSKITNNLSHDNSRYGLHFMFSNDDVYTENVFRENGVGVAVMFSSRIQMIRNEFSHNWGRSSYGLLLKEINDANIQDNLFHQNTIGIFVEGSNRIKYTENNFERNGWAIKFSGGCSANEITRNNFDNNSLDLVVASRLNDNAFHNNFWSNYSGYDLDKDNIGDIPHYPVKLFSYVLDQAPEAIVLLRSLFVDLLNFAEKVSPVFTPKEVFDPSPQMKRIQ